ncbi:peptidase [Rhodobacterales bacterium HKCCE3408]|nr:peptidase [Rhodobacterales bacterium HKCCE3408]
MQRLLATGAAIAALGAPAAAQDTADVVRTYADMAEAAYTDSLTAARTLDAAVDALLAAPSVGTLQDARAAWRAARIPYLQTEVFRFGNPIVDDWEGRVNSWPLDEGLIDYVDAGYGSATEENDFAALNVVANASFTLSGEDVDASEITPAFLQDVLHEADGVEANVATGYHAIEFLLWGQDLNGHGAGAGNRPWTDFSQGSDCTNGNCDRRAEYLDSATDLLVSDLEEIVTAWTADGAARARLLSDPEAGLSAMLTGMGSLSYGELAGERMRLGLMLNDPEEEQDCFSDNTHNSHYYDGFGIQNVYLGSYAGIDGRIVSGPALADLVAAADPALDAEMRLRLSDTMRALGRIKTTAEAGFAYDRMLERGNAGGEALVTAGVEGLIAQTATIERIVDALDLGQVTFEGSDSLDAPSAVFQ